MFTMYMSDSIEISISQVVNSIWMKQFTVLLNFFSMSSRVQKKSDSEFNLYIHYKHKTSRDLNYIV